MALRKFESIFLSTKHEPQIIPEVVSVDSDDDDASHHSHHQSSSTRLGNKRAEDEVMVDFNRWDVEGLVKGVMDKFKILTQMEQCKADALTEATELGNQKNCGCDLVSWIADWLVENRESTLII